MILLIHDTSNYVVEIHRNTELLPSSADICKTIWKLAEKFPEEILVWVERELYSSIQKEKIIKNFDHDLVMLSYAVKTKFMPGAIGYIDQMPFINVKRGVKYPTWRMSSDVGGIKGKTLLKFQKDFGDLSNFNYLLNSVSKVGQQNGLFCYSDPGLLEISGDNKPIATAGYKNLFSFVYQHYKGIWVLVLLFCLFKYEKKFPVVAILPTLLKPKFFKKNIDLSSVVIAKDDSVDPLGSSIDVIIPTIGRAAYVRQVLEDLSIQSLLPKMVIIVEQQPDPGCKSELKELLEKQFPFQIVHIYTHKTGACMARNKALKKVKSEWIFFADDDIRLGQEVLINTMKEARRLRVNCINLNCKQAGEETIFHKVKQWGSFGSGTSVVRSRFAKDLKFSEVFEHGYGEDADFGMKLREKGCDIIYHPKLMIQHLKAPVGGFRKQPVMPWEKETPLPKPSPTVMIFAKRYYTIRQIKGFKISLYLKYFRNQKINNPFTYFTTMENGWKRSIYWAEKLEAENAILKENKP